MREVLLRYARLVGRLACNREWLLMVCAVRSPYLTAWRVFDCRAVKSMLLAVTVPEYAVDRVCDKSLHDVLKESAVDCGCGKSLSVSLCSGVIVVCYLERCGEPESCM